MRLTGRRLLAARLPGARGRSIFRRLRQELAPDHFLEETPGQVVLGIQQQRRFERPAGGGELPRFEATPGQAGPRPFVLGLESGQLFVDCPGIRPKITAFREVEGFLLQR